MLSALLLSLQSSLGQIFSKPFALGSFLPIFLFLAANVGLAAKLGGQAGAWAASANPLLISPSTTTLVWDAAIWIIVVLAVMVWLGLNGFRPELLEGKHLGILARVFYASQVRQAAEIDFQIQDYRRKLREFDRTSKAAAGPNAHNLN